MSNVDITPTSTFAGRSQKNEEAERREALKWQRIMSRDSHSGEISKEGEHGYVNGPTLAKPEREKCEGF